MSPPVVAPIATHFARSLIELQADTIPRMATHIKYVPNFLRTLNPSSLATTAASCSGLSEIVKTKAESKAELISRREAPQPAMSLHVISSPTRSYSGYRVIHEAPPITTPHNILVLSGTLQHPQPL
jgi:hypothetical protein